MIEGLRTPLWQHQREAIEHARTRRGAMFAVRMGGGKTLTTIAMLHTWNARRVLVATPLSVVSTWPRELARHSEWRWNVAALDEGPVAKRTAAAQLLLDTSGASGARCVVVINHESLWRQPFRDLALATPWDAIVVDESHRAKAAGGKLSRFLADLGKRHPLTRRLGLTGTPMPHSPMDLYAQARFLDPSVYGTSFQRFKMRFALLGGYEGREVVGFQRQDELMEKFRRFAFVANAKNLLDLPPELDVEIPVKLEAPAAKVYRQLERDFWVEVEQGTVTASNALVKLLRLQQLTSGNLRLDEGESHPISDAKAEALADLLADMPRGEKVVVFGRFTADIETARRVAESEGRRFGEVSGRRKDLDQGRFPENIDILGVQIAAGGVGIDLSRASTAVFASTGFNLGEYLQARARLYRPGQRQQVTFLHLLAEGTVDWRVYRALQRREEVVTALLEQGQKEAA